MVISKKTIIFQGFRGGPTFSGGGGGNFFSRVGVQILFSIETQVICCDFPGGGSGPPTPPPPSGSAHVVAHHYLNHSIICEWKGRMKTAMRKLSEAKVGRSVTIRAAFNFICSNLFASVPLQLSYT